MRIGYLIGEALPRESGVSKKIDAQVSTWQELGQDVQVYRLPATALSSWRWLAALNRLAARVPPDGIDVLYVRHTTWVPALGRLMRRVPAVLEVNSDDLAELRSRRRSYRAYHRLVRRFALRRAAAVVTPTGELARRPDLSGHARHIVAIPNGIDLHGVLPLLPPDNSRPRLGFTYASGGDWTGIDHVLELARALPEFDVDLIGPGVSGSLPPNVRHLGYLEGAALREAMAHLDVGIGSLALYRARLEEASTLKVRGYLAHGIPAIIGYLDSDFPSGASFLLRIPNRPSGVSESIEAIRTFVLAQLGLRVPRHAIEHLDVREKEQARLSVMAQAASAS